jgi:hypothetical protein
VRDRLDAANQGAGKLTRGNAIFERHGAPFHCPAVSRGTLQESASSGGKIGNNPGGSALQALEIKDIEVGQ